MAPIIIKLLKPRYRKKIAMFDYDHTLVKPKDGKSFPSNVDDWVWNYPTVPEMMKQYYDKGYSIVVFTNQTKEWKVQQIEKVMTEASIPCFICIAMQKDEHKPSKVMFEEFIGTKKWDADHSFFVGDALGRPADWSDVDKKFAEAVGVMGDKILSPEAFFAPKTEKPKPKPKIVPSNAQEVVILVGYPASGKSTIAQTVFKASGYEVVESDALKTVAKIRTALKSALTNGKSAVIDATNPTRERRKEYVDIARAVSANINIRCIHVATTMEEAVARNNLRSKEKGVPMIAYYTYRKRFEEPDKDAEGFDVVEATN